jgi:hypothetical protein
MPRNLEAVPQFKITTKRSTDRALYRKTSIRFREISNYGTDSLLRGGVVGASGDYHNGSGVGCESDDQRVLWGGMRLWLARFFWSPLETVSKGLYVN